MSEMAMAMATAVPPAPEAPPAEAPEEEEEAGYRTPDKKTVLVDSEEEGGAVEAEEKDASSAPAWLERVAGRKRPVKALKRGSRGSPIGRKTRARVPARALTDDEKWQLYTSALLLTLNSPPPWMQGMSMGRLAEMYGV